jgi:hypothetical protein
LETRPVARQLLSSILQYMNSSEFYPAMNIEPEQIAELFTKNSQTPLFHTWDAPDELKKGTK